ncbi:hypothetical protein KY290_007609 [Solanum tuberosum]|uniref:Uncharacterized protein n=1 Tax=Solanum tuberosum TaxID=4113 RepID=A0ABQ7W616_SOLTU|nr:hypothetical protein KY290_007609 [Solanum tuberosum]
MNSRQSPCYEFRWRALGSSGPISGKSGGLVVPTPPYHACLWEQFVLAFWRSPYGSQSSFAEMPFKKIFSHIGTRPTILDLPNSGADGDSPIDSTDSDLDAPAHKHMDRDADSDVARKARLSDS